MKEFGSDFHKSEQNFVGSSLLFEKINCYNLYSSGRHAIEAVITQEKWKRIWIPAYFCYEVIDYVLSLNIQVKLYDDNPINNDEDIIKTLPYEKGDVLLRVNYFGLREKRSNKGLPVPVVEDHTHDVISDWALNSDADWCIASLRKSLPIAAGGILWSPRKKSLPKQITSTQECERMAEIRYDAMTMKLAYLLNEGIDKYAFRKKFIASEEMIENMSISGADIKTYELLHRFDVKRWTDVRVKNWNLAYNLLSKRFNILVSRTTDPINQFSLVVLCKSNEERNSLRQYLIKNSIYPAILWSLPEDSNFTTALNFSRNMLSIHCDGRYNVEDIKSMCNIINAYYD